MKKNTKLRCEDKKINSVIDLIRYLKKDTPRAQPCWFRGQGNIKWKLLPYLAREGSLLKAEGSLIARFKQDATLLIDRHQEREWDWLTIMQHHGAPTRLLDWTESPLVALYFSVYEQFKSDGALWSMLPCVLNRINNITHEYQKYIPHFDDRNIVDNYTPSGVASEKTTSLKPMAVMGPRNTPRMQAQLGVFTVIHRDPIAIEDVGDGAHLWRYIVPRNSKDKIRDELKMIKIGKFQLFPELQRIGEILKDEII